MTDREHVELWMKMVKQSYDPKEKYLFEHECNDEDDTLLEGTLMWVYRRVENGNMDHKFVVGYYTPEKQWQQDSEFGTKQEAAYRVHWLNGGGGQ